MLKVKIINLEREILTNNIKNMNCSLLFLFVFNLKPYVLRLKIPVYLGYSEIFRNYDKKKEIATCKLYLGINKSKNLRLDKF